MNDNWQERGACRDKDPELFFPISTGNQRLRELADAQAVCARCPVKQECDDWAENTGQRWGVWGGQDREDHRRFQRRTPQKPAPAPEVVPVTPPPAVSTCGEKKGTPAGYRRHIRKSETACAPCRAAHNADSRGINKTRIYGITPSVLDAIVQHATTNPRDLARHLKVEPHRVTRALKTLQAKGLLEVAS
jgi:WhiB family redox-sensing transcriptional regulator